MNCKVKQCCAALAARKLAEHDPAVVEITRGGKNKSHHVLRKSDMKKIGLIAGGAFVALTALNVYSHYKVHQAIADRKVKSSSPRCARSLTRSARKTKRSVRRWLRSSPASRKRQQNRSRRHRDLTHNKKRPAQQRRVVIRQFHSRQ